MVFVFQYFIVLLQLVPSCNSILWSSISTPYRSILNRRHQLIRSYYKISDKRYIQRDTRQFHSLYQQLFSQQPSDYDHHRIPTTSNEEHHSDSDAPSTSRSTSTMTGSTRTASERIRFLGPTKNLQALKVGQILFGYRRAYLDSTNADLDQKIRTSDSLKDFTIERVSFHPDVFLLRNFLTEHECDEIIKEARQRNMSRAETITLNDSTSRTHCTVAWIPSTGSQKAPVVSTILSSIVPILLSSHVVADPTASVEDLQVLCYQVGGQFVLHHDGEPRILTVIYYVNGVGGTWFPLARTHNDEFDNDDDDEKRIQNSFEGIDPMQKKFMLARKDPQNKEMALELGKDLIPGKDGLLIKGTNSLETNLLETNQDDTIENSTNPHIAWIQKGDAIAFYNYCNDGTNQLNWRAIHTGLPTETKDGEKWIANHWIRLESLSTME